MQGTSGESLKGSTKPGQLHRQGERDGSAFADIEFREGQRLGVGCRGDAQPGRVASGNLSRWLVLPPPDGIPPSPGQYFGILSAEPATKEARHGRRPAHADAGVRRQGWLRLVFCPKRSGTVIAIAADIRTMPQCGWASCLMGLL